MERSAWKIFVAACLLLANVAATSTANTHVHVLQVDAKTPTGRPIADLTVKYGLNEANAVTLDTTDKDGVAEGTLDVTKLGSAFSQQGLKTVSLFITGPSVKTVEKKISWSSDAELSRGFVVTILAERDRVILGTTGYSVPNSTVASDVAYCNECCSYPWATYRLVTQWIPRYYRWPDGSLTYQWVMQSYFAADDAWSCQ